MSKKFVPLSSCITPADNPYNVKTFDFDDAVPLENIPDGYYQEQPYTCCEGVFGAPPYCRPDAPVTVADEIYNLYRRAQDNRRTQTVRQECKKACCPTDDYYKCVKLQKTPCQLNAHALIREKLLMVQKRDEQRIHDYQEQLEETNCLVALDSPIIVKGKNPPKDTCHHVTPKRASPPVSALILPTKRMAIDKEIFAYDDDAEEANQHYRKQDKEERNSKIGEFVKSDLETLMGDKGEEEKNQTNVKELLESRNELKSSGTYNRNTTLNPMEMLGSESVTDLWIKEIIDENKNRFRLGNLCIKQNSEEEEVELRLTNITEVPQNPNNDVKREIINQLKENEKLLRYDYGSWKEKLAHGNEKKEDEDFLAKELLRNLKRKILLNRILRDWDINQAKKKKSNLKTAPEITEKEHKKQENDSKNSQLLDIYQKKDGNEVERNSQEQEQEPVSPSNVNLQMNNFFSNIFDQQLVHPEVQEVLRVIEEMNTDDGLHSLEQEDSDQNNTNVQRTETAQTQNFMNEELNFDTAGVTENELPEVHSDTRVPDANIEEKLENRQKVLTKREEALLFGDTCIQNISKAKMDVRVRLKNISELKRSVRRSEMRERKKRAASSSKAEKEKSNQMDKTCIQKRKHKENEVLREGKGSTMKIKQKIENNRGITAIHISNKPAAAAGVKKNLKTYKNANAKNYNLNTKKPSKQNTGKRMDANQSCVNMKLRLRNIFEQKDPEIFAWSEEKEPKSKRAASVMFMDQKRKTKERKTTVMEKLWRSIDKKSEKKLDMKTVSQSQILDDILNHSSETRDILEDYMLVERENQIRKTASQWVMEQKNIENNEKLKVKQILEQEQKFRESVLNSKIMDILSLGYSSSHNLSKKNVKENDQNIHSPSLKEEMNIDSIEPDLLAQRISKEFRIRPMKDRKIPEPENSVTQNSSSIIDLVINDFCTESHTELLAKEEIRDEEYSRIEKQSHKVDLPQEDKHSLLPMKVFEQQEQIVNKAKFNINDVILTGKVELCVNDVFFEIFEGEDFGQNYQVELNRKETFLANEFASQYRCPIGKGFDLRNSFLVSNLLVFCDLIDNARCLKGIEKEIKNAVVKDQSPYDNSFIEKFDSESKIYKVTTNGISGLKKPSEQKVTQPTAEKELQIELLHRMQSAPDSGKNLSVNIILSQLQPADTSKQNLQVFKVRQCEKQMTGAKLEEIFDENKPSIEFSHAAKEELQETKSNSCVNEPADKTKSHDENLNNNCYNGNGDSNVQDLAAKSEKNFEKQHQQQQQEITNENMETFSEHFMVVESTNSIYKWLGKDVSKKLCNLKDEGLKTKIAATIETILQEELSPERLTSDEDISEKDSDSSEYGSCSFYHSCLDSSETSVTYV